MYDFLAVTEALLNQGIPATMKAADGRDFPHVKRHILMLSADAKHFTRDNLSEQLIELAGLMHVFMRYLCSMPINEKDESAFRALSDYEFYREKFLACPPTHLSIKMCYDTEEQRVRTMFYFLIFKPLKISGAA